MSIYTYNFLSAISKALNIQYFEIEDLSDQSLYKLVNSTKSTNITSPQLQYIKLMTVEERKQMTKSANNMKRGSKESNSSRKLKSLSQKERWKKTTKEQRKEHGIKSRNGISIENRKTQTRNALESFSPVRQKGYKQPLVQCPHCEKTGGNSSMKRFHFENCKELK